MYCSVVWSVVTYSSAVLSFFLLLPSQCFFYFVVIYFSLVCHLFIFCLFIYSPIVLQFINLMSGYSTIVLYGIYSSIVGIYSPIFEYLFIYCRIFIHLLFFWPLINSVFRSRWSRNYLRPGAGVGAETIFLIKIYCSQFSSTLEDARMKKNLH